MIRWFRWAELAAILFLLLLSGNGQTAVFAQTDDDADNVNLAAAQALLDQMNIEERVGQLFVVTFKGDAANQESAITDLILNYRIGGVVLLPENDNITGYGNLADTPQQVTELTNALQRLSILGHATIHFEPDDLPTEPTIIATPGPKRTTVPLIIAVNQEGDGSPYSAIFNGLTELPSSMAIGATWQPDYARNVGEIVGRELAAVGVNMLLGPSLDVLENPHPDNPSDMGVRSFGGDPYWVGLMGRAYTAGIHQGGNDRLAVVAKHFPGNGNSDRPVDQEVPTVRQSLEQLKQIELAPFFAVTDTGNGRAATADALLVTHIRYQGFQGNIRATTAPVSFDPQALVTLMTLPQFTSWRQNGGVIISDSLGVRAVKRFYDNTEQEFPHRQVAKDAFLAGNDLLYLSNFAAGNAPYADQLNNIRDTIVWFREKYLTDQTFQQRVDAAVLHILQLKLRLYDDDFSLSNVLADETAVTDIVGQGGVDLIVLAQEAITLIAPSQDELAERLASPPGNGDAITIFTDVRQAVQCSLCPPQALIGKTALQERILALYGPEGSSQVEETQIHSFTFDDLQAFLDAPGPIILPTPIITSTVTASPENTPLPDDVTPTPPPTATPLSGYAVQEALRDTNWIIFAMLDGAPESRALKNFLAVRPDIVRDTRVIVFAYNAPYYLDTTEISKLTAFYGVYSKTDPFIDASVRALFQESLLSGASPVDIEGINYNLFNQTQPDPGQVIELYLADEGTIQAPPSEAPLETLVGETLHLQTGIIQDRNGHAVPDGTVVQFIQLDRIQGLVNIIADIPTMNGVAQLDYVLEARPGQFRITAVSGDAAVSQEVDIVVLDEGAQIAIIAPTATATPTPPPTATATPTPPPTDTPVPTLTITPTPTRTPPQEPAVRIALSEFQMLLAMFTGLLVIGTTGVVTNRRHTTAAQHVGWLFWGTAGGLLLYIYSMLDLPGTAVLAPLGSWAGLISTLAGGAVGFALKYLRIRRQPSARQVKNL